MVSYNKVFDVAYSTSIPESVKGAILEKLDIPILESIEASSEVAHYVNFLNKMAYSNMSESLTDMIIDRVMGNLDEAFVEEIYEEYIKVKTLEYVSEANPPIGLTGLRKMQDAEREANNKSLAMNNIKGALNTAKNAVAGAATTAGNKIKAATEPARDVASYTAHKAKEGGKAILNKVKGAVGKVKNWWNDYKSKAKAYGDTKRQEAQDRKDEEFLKPRNGESKSDYKARIKASGKYAFGYPAEIGEKRGRWVRKDKLEALRQRNSKIDSFVSDAEKSLEQVAK